MGWLLTTLPDPMRRERFGGEGEEFEIVGSYIRAIDDLDTRLKKAHVNNQADPPPANAHTDPANPDKPDTPRGKGKKGKDQQQDDA